MVNPAPLMDRKLICAGILSMNREVLSVADKIVSVVNGPVLSGGLFDPISNGEAEQAIGASPGSRA